MLRIVLVTIISYLIGSIPTAYIFGRWLKGIDIRQYGSGNVGATNALRVLGKGPGIAVLLLDVIKGLVAVLFLGGLLEPEINLIGSQARYIILGLACISGHNWTVFLSFKGGKGVATTLGVLAGLAIKISGLKLILGLMLLTWLAVFLIARIVSLASVIAAVSFPIYMLLFKQSRALFFTSLIFTAFILLRHKSNLKRIFQGKEPRLKF